MHGIVHIRYVASTAVLGPLPRSSGPGDGI